MPITVDEVKRMALMPPTPQPGFVGMLEGVLNAPGTELLPSPGMVFQRCGMTTALVPPAVPEPVA